METRHKILIADSRDISNIASASIDLAVTSPPYPMIEMWDSLFSSLSAPAADALAAYDGNRAYEAMHTELDKVWRELFRVLKPSAFACINIGDATRKIGERFRLYPNHSRIIESFHSLGFDTLPLILWRKQTNAPNKFMGSGMLPSGAYVTLEHEYILVFRKGEKREFRSPAEKSLRAKSAFFWEERNKWFSDVWDFKGTGQTLKHAAARKRSAAFPFELAYRLINMYSLYGDTVLDPFAGTGTTMLAAIACARNSMSVEIDPAFSTFIIEQALAFTETGNLQLGKRIFAHQQFVASHRETKGELKYSNIFHGFPVKTQQEIGIELYKAKQIESVDRDINVSYTPFDIADDSIGRDNENKTRPSETSEQLTLDF